ncbi:MAG: ABC transporter ATP-binding protein, partial [Clostridia bacterium]|nr:ABC transporter ATP-binding protein [Clostridia bacterium]
MVIVAVRLTKMIYPYFGIQQREFGRLNAFIEERVSGIKIISLYQQQKENAKEFYKLNTRITENSVIANAFGNVFGPLNTFFNNMAFVVLSAVGITLVVNGFIQTDWGIIAYKNPAALLVIFTILSRNITNPTNQLMSSMGPLAQMMAAAQRVFELLDEKEEEKDPEDAIELKNIKGVVEAKNLYFGYNPNTLVLRDINFKAEPNKVTALVGPTGAGKTTITSLITKFYDVTFGQLTIDGKPIQKIDRHSLRKYITCVLQDTFLFTKSIRDNIKYARPSATDEEVIAAAKASYAHDFITKLPFGYDTILTDNGQNLSQGQRQMLAIARAFLADAKIIILDEASSSIDTKTENDLQKAFETLMKGRTTFMIAHRLSTIKNA